ncbi:alpha-terpineol synthase, chloroplastic-like [Tasmannia lanceolata]|uniref:alpha-terpineol synthase, chloroplastic-like n=1 Tax=Tasmannia lanceolata TaxID=3420 RepID=UPI004062D7DD
MFEPHIIRRSANYPQSFGDYDFIQSLKSDYTGEMYERRVEKLKDDVRRLFEKMDKPRSRLELIDTLQRLGLAYHFKKGIKEALGIISMDEMEGELYATSLRFRLLRQHGFEVSTGEIVLEEARAFTTKHLKDLKGKITDQNLKIQVEHALELPLHWRMPRLESRWYIETYVRQVDMNPLLFELAKLDFNVVQAIYQSNIKDTSRTQMPLMG